jgi:tetratricopeptide (TPR) repeat protein
MAFNKAKALQGAEKLVIQGKISQAIRQYSDILERDPSDVILLNTIGDLYIRDRNVPEGLKQFYRLAEAYVRDGIVLKAIAIYKKIVKLEPDSVDPLLKLVELYQTQRLAREARDLYYQVAECYKKKKQTDKALETLRKVVQLDIENVPARVRLAAFCEEIGRKDEATQVYLETAQLAFGRGDLAAAQVTLKKVQELDPDNPRILLLRAREALATKHPEEVEAILSAIPGLKDDPTGRSLLLDSYLSTQQMEKAEKLVPDLFRANPTDFSLVASFVLACVQVDEFDTASRVLSGLADELIKQGNTSSLMESLRLIWSKSPQHLPTLELIYRICDEREEEYALPEILEALGHAYVQCGQLEKAEQAFQRLVSREPANERYKVLLKHLLKKQGKEVGKVSVAGLPSCAIGLTQEEGLAAPAVSALGDAGREAMVKQALDNSELFARYDLVKKAVAELDRVLAIYPDEPEIHRRLVGICWKVMPERAEQAAQALVRICTQQGDAEGAKRFAQMAGGREALAEEAIPPKLAPGLESPSATGAGTPSDPAIAPAGEAPLPAPLQLPIDPSRLASPAPPPAATFEIQEVDLSEDWKSFQAQAASASLAPETPPEAVSFNYEDSRIEINFYLENGFLEEARKAVEELERALPSEPRIAELRALVEAHTGAMAAEVPEKRPAETFTEATTNLLGDLADAFGSAMGELAEPSPPPAPPSATTPEPATISTAQTPAPASPLDGLLEEIGEAFAMGPDEEDDPETHYNLGVAFREMNLLDEAIGEFQKVVKGAGKGPRPPNYLQACSLLAICFMDKGMAPIAIKWYCRALETPDLDEEALLALQYDLGVAWEQAGDTRRALEKFTEVYGQNIDFRDVAEKIRLFQQKGS